MPQLNHATFLTQVFWFVIFFLLFYSFVMYFVLPKLFTCLRVRQRKREMTFQNMTPPDLSSYHQSFAQVFQLSRETLQSSLQNTHDRTSTQLSQIHQTTLQESYQTYLKTFFDLSKESLAFHKKLTSK